MIIPPVFFDLKEYGRLKDLFFYSYDGTGSANSLISHLQKTAVSTSETAAFCKC